MNFTASLEMTMSHLVVNLNFQTSYTNVYILHSGFRHYILHCGITKTEHLPCDNAQLFVFDAIILAIKGNDVI